MIPPFKPMEPMAADQLKTGSEWIHQVKWDGVRMLAHLDRGQVRLWNRKGQERTMQYPELVEELRELPCQPALLDGEVFVIHEGRSDFFQVLKRDLLRDLRRLPTIIKQIPVQYQVFDLLMRDGISLVEREWEERNQHLRSFLEDLILERVAVIESFADGEALWQATAEQDWEGIVMKRKNSPYRIGQKHADWQKMKHFRTLTAQLVGVSLRGRQVNAVLLGVQSEDENNWRYIGRAASGLGEQEWALLSEWWPQMKVPQPLVVNPPAERGVIWVRPMLSVTVRYLEWTPHGTLRSPVILHFLTK